MDLTPGKTLLHYRLEDKLGEGGMGVVWRATDTTLGRDVAIKILPDTFAFDADRRARFEREARVLASLNHPGIAVVHGLHEQGGLHFLAMELVPGEDLARRLTRGPLPLDEVLEAGRQIAEALEEANERGVIHRDLKPANVKRTPEGKLKVLDFGLAKALSPDEPAQATNPELSPTLTDAGTAAGLILGTAAYMSPEQAKGRAVDRRADIWAFGVLLYESLTGEQPFRGETVSETLAAVLLRDPDWSHLPTGTPRALERLLRRCLERDPRKRLRDIGEARLTLEELIAGADEPASVEPTAQTARHSRTWIWGFAGLVAGAAATAWLLGVAPPATPDGPAHVLLSVTPAKGINVGPTLGEPAFAISPDGRTVAFVATVPGDADVRAASQLLVRRLDQTAAVPLAGTEGAKRPFFSPDGQSIAFFTGYSIQRVPVSGGLVDTVFAADDNRTLFGAASWSRDLGIVCAGVLRDEDGTAHQGVWSLDPDTGDLEPIHVPETVPTDGRPVDPVALPGGRALLWVKFEFATRQSTVEIFSRKEGSARALAPGSRPAIAPGNRVVFADDGRLLAATIDLDRLEFVGSPRVVAEGLVTDTIDGTSSFAVSTSGTLAYLSADSVNAQIDNLVWVDQDGNPTSAGAAPALYLDMRLSPDGKKLAFSIPTGEADAWVRDLERMTQTRLTFDPADDETPVWSPDGRWIAYSSNRAEKGRILTRAADGSGAEHTVWEGEAHIHVGSWTRDGKTLVIDARGVPGQTAPNTQPEVVNSRNVWAIDVEGGGEPRVVLGDPFNVFHARLSPDDRWLSYTSYESGQPEVYVQPWPALDRKIPISVDGGAQGVWSRDSRTIYYRSGPQMLAVDLVAGGEPSFSSPRLVFEHDYGTGGRGDHFSYDVAPDGRFIMTLGENVDFQSDLQLVLNWDRELDTRLGE